MLLAWALLAAQLAAGPALAPSDAGTTEGDVRAARALTPLKGADAGAPDEDAAVIGDLELLENLELLEKLELVDQAP